MQTERHTHTENHRDRGRQGKDRDRQIEKYRETDRGRQKEPSRRYDMILKTKFQALVYDILPSTTAVVTP